MKYRIEERGQGRDKVYIAQAKNGWLRSWVAIGASHSDKKNAEADIERARQAGKK